MVLKIKFLSCITNSPKPCYLSPSFTHKDQHYGSKHTIFYVIPRQRELMGNYWTDREILHIVRTLGILRYIESQGFSYRYNHEWQYNSGNTHHLFERFKI